jgi:hypothetical protein
MAGAFTPIYWGEESLPIRGNCTSYRLQELQSSGLVHDAVLQFVTARLLPRHYISVSHWESFRVLLLNPLRSSFDF